MKKYEVTVQAVIRKTYTVEADNEDMAQLAAYDMFTVTPDEDEYYDQKVIDVYQSSVDDESRSNGPRS
jgi:hypothetical protein